MKRLGVIMMFMIANFAIAAKESIAIVNFDVIGSDFEEAQYLSMATSEIRKLDTMVVVDKYSVAELLQERVPKDQKCFGVKCLSKIGKELGVDYVLSGSAEQTGEKLSVNIRIINPETKEVVESDYMEYLYDEDYIWKFMEMSMQSLFGKKIRQTDLAVFEFNRAKSAELEGPRVKPYNLSGPRFGVSYITGLNKSIMESHDPGGFGKSPAMTVIGYQYEKSYLYTGAVQAVFQMNFSLSGLDQQMAIPSMSFLNGFRASKNGWEIGFGPVFRFKKVQEGYKSESGQWVSQDDDPGYEGVLSKRLDSRGITVLQPGWIWAVGKSFKAGSMNMPVNLYAIPDNDGWLFGFSFGYAIHK